MTWFKVDDALHAHPKARKAGLEALGLWSVSGSHCMAYLTNGFVEESFVKLWPRGTRLARRLVEVGLWLEAEQDGQKGWQFHDWEKYQPTKEQVEAEREKARVRKARQRESLEESRRDSQRDGRRTSQAPRPDPTRPDLSSSVELEGEVASGDAQEPSPRCPQHENHADPPNCLRCKDARLAHEAWESGELDRRRKAKAAAAAEAAACIRCHGTNTYDIADNQAAKCWPHITQEASA